MAHSVTISTVSPSPTPTPSPSPSPSPCVGVGLGSQKIKNSQQSVGSSSRRDVGLRLVGTVFGFGLMRNADAAARRPPPTPPTEKKDPNVSGVLAKVIASKKRKEAMKESMAQLREKGNLITPPAPE